MCDTQGGGWWYSMEMKDKHCVCLVRGKVVGEKERGRLLHYVTAWLKSSSHERKLLIKQTRIIIKRERAERQSNYWEELILVNVYKESIKLCNTWLSWWLSAARSNFYYPQTDKKWKFSPHSSFFLLMLSTSGEMNIIVMIFHRAGGGRYWLQYLKLKSFTADVQSSKSSMKVWLFFCCSEFQSSREFELMK